MTSSCQVANECCMQLQTVYVKFDSLPLLQEGRHIVYSIVYCPLQHSLETLLAKVPSKPQAWRLKFLRLDVDACFAQCTSLSTFRWKELIYFLSLLICCWKDPLDFARGCCGTALACISISYMILADLKDKCQHVGHVADHLLRLSYTSHHLCIDDCLCMTHNQHHIGQVRPLYTALGYRLVPMSA